MYPVNNTISHLFTGDGISHLRGIETQTVNIHWKLYIVIDIGADAYTHLGTTPIIFH